jgi:glyoxylase-like metal-dependent hydrolase (beta-lactamase superfamily II)
MVISLSWIKEEGQLNENTYLIDSFLFGNEGNMACYLVEGEEKKVLIDASGKPEAKRIIKKLKDLGKIPDMLILTHSHWDHAGGTSVFKSEFPNMEIMASHQGINSLQNLQEYNQWFKDVSPRLKSVEDVTPLKEGVRLDLGGLELEIFETPGHTNCSICILDRKNKALFIGDSIGYKLGEDLLLGPIMPPEYSHDKLMKTYEKVKKIKYSSIFIAHFGYLTGELARNLPDTAKSNYLYWRDFALSKWNENSSKEYVIEAFRIQFSALNLTERQKDAYANMFGDWVVKGLQTAKLI